MLVETVDANIKNNVEELVKVQDSSGVEEMQISDVLDTEEHLKKESELDDDTA